MSPLPRPPLPAGRARLAAALLESSLLLTVGALFVGGLVAEGDAAPGPSLPMRLGPRALPLLAVVGAYAVQRVLLPRPRAFLAAGALAASAGAVMAPGLSAAQRAGHGALALVVGALVTWWSLPLDHEGDRLIEATAWTGRELFFAACLVFLGTLPAAIAGGFLLVIPSMLVALLIIGRNLHLELATLRQGDRGRLGALVRLVIGIGLGLMALGMATVGTMLSLGAGVRDRERASAPVPSAARPAR